MEKKSTPSRGSSSKSSSRQLSESFKSKEFGSSDESSPGENKSKKKRRRSEVRQESGGSGAWEGEGHLSWWGRCFWTRGCGWPLREMRGGILWF